MQISPHIVMTNVYTALRIERQVEPPPTDAGGMPDLMPWIQMGSKYGLIAASDVVVPLGIEAYNQTAQG